MKPGGRSPSDLVAGLAVVSFPEAVFYGKLEGAGLRCFMAPGGGAGYYSDGAWKAGADSCSPSC